MHVLHPMHPMQGRSTIAPVPRCTAQDAAVLRQANRSPRSGSCIRSSVAFWGGVMDLRRSAGDYRTHPMVFAAAPFVVQIGDRHLERRQDV